MSTGRLLYRGAKTPRAHPGQALLDKVAAGSAHIAAPGHGVLLYNGRCEAPITMRDLAQRSDSAYMLGTAPAGIYDTVVRCRKCAACRRYTRSVWTKRAEVELAQATRTWFGTLTIEPNMRYMIDIRARGAIPERRLANGEVVQPSLEVLNRARWVDIGRECQLWLKRARKAAGDTSRLRHLLVAELHEDGYPHVHCLIHEVAGKITYRELRAAWRWGFSSFSIVRNPKAARHYATKYITKSPQSRIRASLRYGAWRTANASSCTA